MVWPVEFQPELVEGGRHAESLEIPLKVGLGMGIRIAVQKDNSFLLAFRPQGLALGIPVGTHQEVHGEPSKENHGRADTAQRGTHE